VATDVNGAPTAANVIVDVDLNNDNDFGDASETGYMTATSAMTTGLAIFGARKGVRDRFQL
jgi:hypothetical protein